MLMYFVRTAVLLQQIHIHFFSGSPAFSFFFAFAFFLPLRSLFFNAVVPAFMTSAYLVKNSSNWSGCTMVESLILFLRNSFDLPFVARMSTGRGDERVRSGKRETGPELEGEKVVDDCGVTRVL